MTFTELRQHLEIPMIQAEWTKHRDGGWVYHLAHVDPTATIQGIVGPGSPVVQDKASVLKGARIYGNARMGNWAVISGPSELSGTAVMRDRANVFGSARVSGNSLLRGYTRVFDNARVYGNAQVGDMAKVCGDSHVHGEATLSGDIAITNGSWDKPPLYIQGSIWSAFNGAPGKITIGCNTGTFNWWVKNYKMLAEEHELTPDEKSEYWSYIKLITKLGK